MTSLRADPLVANLTAKWLEGKQPVVDKYSRSYWARRPDSEQQTAAFRPLPTLLPRQGHSSLNGKSVTYVSGTICDVCVEPHTGAGSPTGQA